MMRSFMNSFSKYLKKCVCNTHLLPLKAAPTGVGLGGKKGQKTLKKNIFFLLFIQILYILIFYCFRAFFLTVKSVCYKLKSHKKDIKSHKKDIKSHKKGRLNPTKRILNPTNILTLWDLIL